MQRARRQELGSDRREHPSRRDAALKSSSPHHKNTDNLWNLQCTAPISYPGPDAAGLTPPDQPGEMASVLDLSLDFDTPGDRLKWLLVVQLGLSAFLSDSAAAVAVLGLVAVVWTQRELLSLFLVGFAQMAGRCDDAPASSPVCVVQG